MSEPADTLPTLGKYRLVRELGRGGSGIVYEAVDITLDRKVALKVFAENPLASAAERAEEEQRFLREAKLTANLPKHPSIVSLYEANVLAGRRYLAMEFVEGVAFSKWCDRESADLRRRVEILRDAALAVQHAHEHGVIHRDLKPENILVDTGGRPHLTDFGLAKQVGAQTSLTGGGMVVGTPHYMSPEQAQGLKTLDHRTDIYSLGIMLYEFLAGRRPFEGDSAMEIMIKAVRTQAPPLTEVQKGPLGERARGLDRVCLKAIAKQPDRRYASARLFAEDLTTWLSGGDVHVRSGQTTRRLRKPERSGSRGRTLALGGILLATAAIAVVVHGGNPEVPPKPPVGQPPAAPATKPGAIAEYFVGHNFEALVRRVVDPKIDFDWTGKEPWPGGPTENFSVRWKGFFDIPKSGPVSLVVRSDDGARLSIDGKQVLDHWTPHPPTADAVPLELEKGPHEFTLDYHQGIREAVIQIARNRDGTLETLAVYHKPSEFAPLELPAGGREDVPGAQEGESLRVVEGSGTQIIPFEWFGKWRRGSWSGPAHLWWGAKVKPGDRLRVVFVSAEAGRKTVVLGLTKSKDHGIHRILINGTIIAPTVDLYDPGLPMLRLEFPGVELKAGDNELEFVAVGTNPLAGEWRPGSGLYKLGLDYILVK